MIGNLIGVFGSNQNQKSTFLGSIGKKSETEGIIVYQRSESGVKYSLLDDAVFPEKIQGYARIASICDYAYYVIPADSKLTAPDGELAILLDVLSVKGEIVVIDGKKDVASEIARSSFKGLSLGSYAVTERSSESSVVDFSRVKSQNYPTGQSLVYIDRAFNVKGLGVVVLGFVLCGKVSVHDKLRILPTESGKFAEVKGIQISDEDYDSTERGIRVGLSLKGIELKDLSKTSWLDDGSFKVATDVDFSFKQPQYYKQPTVDRDLHLEASGELLVSKIVQGKKPESRIAKLQQEIPIWEGMKVAVIDLNSKSLRVAGGGVVEV